MLGSISLRMILIFLALSYSILYAAKNRLAWCNLFTIIVVFVSYMFLTLCIGLLKDNDSNALDEFLGYLPILLVFFYSIYFNNGKDRIEKMFSLFNSLTIVLSILSLILWLYCFFNGYVQVNRILNKYNYGLLSRIGTIPRLFLKSSIFALFGLIYSLNNLIDGKRNLKALFCITVTILTIITTFTTSFYFFSIFVIAVFVIVKIKSRINTNIFRIAVAFILTTILFYVTGSFDILFARFTDTYNFNTKATQAVELLKIWLNHFVLGTGLGEIIPISYENGIKYSYMFEVQWLELAAHAGFIGIGIYLLLIFLTVRKLHRLYIKQNNSLYLILSLMIIYICLVSFTNPFMNNSIGLIFFAMAVGVVTQTPV